MDLGLVFVYVEARGEDPTVCQGFRQGSLVNDGTARGVDEDGLGFHSPQLGLADKVVRRLGERGMDGDEIGCLEQFVEVEVAGSELPLGLLPPGAVVVEDVHPEAFRAAGDGLSDPAKPDDTKLL